MTPAHTTTGDGTDLRHAYQSSATENAGIAKRLLHTLFIWQCCGVVLNTPHIMAENPRVHLTVEHLLHLLPNNALVGHAPRAALLACMKRAGMLSNFREAHVFGTDDIHTPQQNQRGHLYVQAAQDMGFFKSNSIIIESSTATPAQMHIARSSGLRVLLYQPDPTVLRAPDTFTTLSDFLHLVTVR